MVGSTDNSYEEKLGSVLAKYFDIDHNVFVISSDFCHWGANFDYYYYKKEDGPVHESVKKLDEEGM